LTIEMVSKVLSELKNLKHQGLLLGASSQQWNFHPPQFEVGTLSFWAIGIVG
jgi:hypothetical protein